MVKSHQKLSNDLLDIIEFSVICDRSYPLAKMVFPGILRSLPTVEMTKDGQVEMITDKLSGKLAATAGPRGVCSLFACGVPTSH
jgi:hypothetical protein